MLLYVSGKNFKEKPSQSCSLSVFWLYWEYLCTKDNHLKSLRSKYSMTNVMGTVDNNIIRQYCWNCSWGFLLNMSLETQL